MDKFIVGRLVSILLVSFLFLLARAEVAGFCGLTKSQAAQVKSCVERFSENNCGSFSYSDESKKFIDDCSVGDLDGSQKTNDLKWLDSCGAGIKESFATFSGSVKNFPKTLVKITSTDEMIIAATKANNERKTKVRECEDKYELNYDQLLEGMKIKVNRAKTESNLYKLNLCINSIDGRDNQIALIKDTVLNLKSEMVKFSHCFKPEYQAQVLCPVIASMLAGGVAVKGLSMGIRLAVRLSVMKKLKTYDAYFAELYRAGVLDKEILSIQHQKDLLSMLENPKVRDLLKALNLAYPEELILGILDSDAGKTEWLWKARVLNSSSESERLLDALKGVGSTRSSKAMKELFQEDGLKPLLNPELSNSEIRTIFTNKPLLQTYLHEIPGMAKAFDDLERSAGALADIEKFKARMRANLFHNGPHAGFWKDFGEKFVPGKLDDEKSKSFFVNTVFDSGKRTAQGSPVLSYPASLSQEGVIHTLFDRMSSATRGGMVKIFRELSPILEKNNNPMALMGEIKGLDGKSMGLNYFNEVLFETPGRASEQLSLLKKNLASIGKISAENRRLIENLISDGEVRLKTQNDFIAKSVKVSRENGAIQKIEISFPDGSLKTVSANTPAKEALESLNQFMIKEEKANGDPIRSLGVTAPRALAAPVASLSAAALCLSHQSKSVSGTQSDLISINQSK